MIKLLHTSDWHLGRRFASIGGDAATYLRDQRFETVRTIAMIARDKGVEAILVAGDAFHSNDVTDETLHKLLPLLNIFSKPWIFIPGNHDPARPKSVWERLKKIDGLKDNIKICLEETPIEILNGRLVTLPAVLRRKHESRDTTEWFDRAETKPGAVRVGLAHGDCGDLPGNNDHNRINKERANLARLAYLALGDWHNVKEISESVWYSGTHEPDNFPKSEPGPGHVLIVTIDEAGGGLQKVEPVSVKKYRWVKKDLPLSDNSLVADIDDFQKDLEGQYGKDSLRETHLRISLSGNVSLSENASVEKRFAKMRGETFHLDLENNLKRRPTKEELDDIDRSGYVRQAVETLQSMGDQGDEKAESALLLLYSMHLDLFSTD